ncbi:hypothetical protein Tco_1043744 [Tanacetum coccineum]|uniref:Uncharacterized protein n=1 Tax=Tanacetum coccineum TaxID=301880 RepID=A0ABQ5GNG6_9ASTR
MRKTPENDQQPTGVAGRGQPTGWAAQPYGWESDETPADRLEGCKATQGSYPNPLIANFEKRNKQGTIEYHLQQVKNANLKWRELPSVERHAYYERLSRLQDKGFGIPRVPSWTLVYDYNIEETLKNKMKYEYLYDDGDLIGLGLYEEDELNHGLFAIHFTKLEVDDKLFNHEEFWTSSKFRCQKRDMWMMSALEESRGINLAWVIAEHLCKHAPGLKENSLICGGHYLTKIAHLLGYLNEEEVVKCSEPIVCKTWTVRMLVNELDEGTHTLLQIEQEAPQTGQAIRKRQEPRGLDSSWRDWNASLNKIKHQPNFAYPAYEPPNVPPYPYPYVPYPHPYMHYPDTGSPSFRGDHYGAHGDGYHAGSIIPSSGYEIGGSSAGFHGEDFDPIVHSEDCVESDDDEMRD